MNAQTLTTSRRARIAGRLAQGGVALFVVLVAVLHVLRPDVSPVDDPLSAYAVGPHGWLMTVAFLANAFAFAALATGISRGFPVSTARRRTITVLLVVASAGMAVAAFAPTDVPVVSPPTPTGLIHTVAALAAFLALAAAGALSLGSFWGAPGATPRTAAAVLVIGALISLVVFLGLTFGGLAGAGLAQRILTALLLAWVALAGGRLAVRSSSGS